MQRPALRACCIIRARVYERPPAVMALATTAAGPAAAAPYLANAARKPGDVIVRGVPSIGTWRAPLRALCFAASSKMLMTGIPNRGEPMVRRVAGYQREIGAAGFQAFERRAMIAVKLRPGLFVAIGAEIRDRRGQIQ